MAENNDANKIMTPKEKKEYKRSVDKEKSEKQYKENLDNIIKLRQSNGEKPLIFGKEAMIIISKRKGE